MRKMKKTIDVSGRVIALGDTVTTINGDLTGKICDICRDADVNFVRVRPLHQSYGQGMWHAADRTMWLSTARPRPKKVDPKKAVPKSGASKSAASSHARKG